MSLLSLARAFAFLAAVALLGAGQAHAEDTKETSFGAIAQADVAQADVADAAKPAADEVRAEEPDDARKGGRTLLRPEQMIDELITTARKRNEIVQTTPVAVTTFGIEELEARDVRRLSDVDGLVPNVAIDNSLGAAAAGRLTIRGVGQLETTTSFDPAVGVYVDGAYVSRAQGQIGSIFDVERIEVLRGPQGTLYGKNTIGGAINITTRKPEFDFGASGTVRVGNYDRLDTRWTVNVPLVAERAALRVAFASNYDEGYEKNKFLGERLATDRLLGTRTQLLVVPTNNLEWMLSGEYTREDRKPQASRCFVSGAPAPVVAATQGMELTADGFATCAASQARSEKSFASDLPADDDFRVVHLTNTVNWEISDTLMLRSITSYRNQHYDVQQDLDGTELGIAQSEPDRGIIASDAYSQEFQLSGRAYDDKLFYVLGVFGFGEKVSDDTPGGGSLLAPELQRRIPLQTTDPTNPDAQIGLPLPLLEETRDVENRSFAGYGSVTYEVTSRLSATAGLRRTVERRRLRKRDAVLSATGFNPATFALVNEGDVVFDFDGSARFDDFSPSASLSFELTPRTLTYASYSTGFRSGGFNGRANFLNPDITEIKPEDLTTYEVGVKSSFFDSRLVVNAAGFYSIYEDIQRPIVAAGPNGLLAIFFRNAAEARLQGAEVEFAALPLPGLKLESSFGAFRGRYTDFDDPSSPRIDDARLPGQPNYLMSFAVGYQLPVAWLGLVSSRVQWTHRGQQANDARDTEEIRSSKYGLLDARLSLMLNDGKTELSLFGSNLLDRVYINNGIDASDTAGRGIVFTGPPRRYGLEVKRDF
jgi:iron complex outermembrane recepter protein